MQRAANAAFASSERSITGLASQNISVGFRRPRAEKSATSVPAPRGFALIWASLTLRLRLLRFRVPHQRNLAFVGLPEQVTALRPALAIKGSVHLETATARPRWIRLAQ